MTPEEAQAKPSQTRAYPRRTRLRTAGLRAAAVAVVLSPLVMLELGLRVYVPAPAVDLGDPYISFSGLRPLFVLDATGTQFETDEERLTYFRPQSFAATKSPETFRIFCLGGSTVQGRPHSVETSFTTWLELNLRASRPETTWEVVNCGGISYASYRLVPIMRELTGHEPDLFIIYMGHNEFLEDRTYRILKRAPRTLFRLHQVMLNSRGYALASRFLSSRLARNPTGEAPGKSVLPTEVQAKLDMRDGLERYSRDDVWRAGTVEHFRRNLETMLQIAEDTETPVILVNPVSNLKDCLPFKSEFLSNLSAPDAERVADLWKRGRGLEWTEVREKLRLLEQAVALDERHADLLYLIGKCYERMGRFTEAKEWFIRAKEQDVCPLRILEPMHRAILDAASQHRVPLVDVKALVEERSEDGIPGEEWLLDHVHPSIAGHQLIADSLYRTLEQMELVRTPSAWQTTRDDLWREHLASLNPAYYAHGAERLQRVQRWSRGRIPEPPTDLTTPEN